MADGKNCRSLGCPGFPVESCGFGQLHVVLFEENHITGGGESGEVGNLGTLGVTKGEVELSFVIPTGAERSAVRLYPLTNPSPVSIQASSG